MPFNPPIPDPKPRGGARGVVNAIVQAEKMMQIALVLPCAAFIGWLGGAWIGKYLHYPWLPMAGIVIGIVSGLISVIRLALAIGTQRDSEGENGTGAK